MENGVRRTKVKRGSGSRDLRPPRPSGLSSLALLSGVTFFFLLRVLLKKKHYYLKRPLEDLNLEDEQAGKKKSGWCWAVMAPCRCALYISALPSSLSLFISDLYRGATSVIKCP